MSFAARLVDLAVPRIERWSFDTVGRRGSALGRLLFGLDRRHRRVALNNLAIAFPDATPEWRTGVARRSFEQMGRTTLELLWSSNLATREQLDRHVTMEGAHHLHASIAAGHGTILATAHYGNWELLGLTAPLHGFELLSLARPLDDAALNERLLRLRTLTGQRILSKHNALRPTIKALRNGETVGILMDQNTVRREAVFVPFFGRLAATTPAVATLQQRTGASILPVFSVPSSRGYRVVIDAPLEIPDVAESEAMEAITAAATARIEAQIRERPEAWLWMHDRWRERP